MNYVIGDVHGAGTELVGLLRAVIFKVDQDKLWFVGDLFDRGFTPNIVWKILNTTDCVACLGNHEIKMRDYIRGKRKTVPQHYDFALRRMMQDGISPEMVADFIDQMPLLVQPTPETIVVHGGVCLDNALRPNVDANCYANFNPKKPMPRPRPGDKIPYWWDHYTGVHVIIYGHLVDYNGQVRRRHNSIGIDTGVVHGLPLTAYCIETGLIHQFKSGVDQFGLLKSEFKWIPPEPVFRY
jgi:diadenosine tetraphosphatase ApaH/serine/threonine PP2A family protein phosphatase